VERKDEVVWLLLFYWRTWLIVSLPSNRPFLHFNFSGNLGSCGQNDRLARNNFHIVLICSKPLAGTKLTAAASSQP